MKFQCLWRIEFFYCRNHQTWVSKSFLKYLDYVKTISRKDVTNQCNLLWQSKSMLTAGWREPFSSSWLKSYVITVLGWGYQLIKMIKINQKIFRKRQTTKDSHHRRSERADGNCCHSRKKLVDWLILGHVLKLSNPISFQFFWSRSPDGVENAHRHIYHLL